MTDTETKKIMAILKAAYPAFYSKMGRDELYGVVEVWHDAFSDIPYELVAVAVKSLIKTHSGYPPDIAAVHLELKNVVSAATGEPTDEELWNIYKRAVQSSGYCENETFEKLPPILQRYCGDAGTLHEHANMKLETFLSVLHGQFLKQLPILRQRQEYRDSLPEPVMNIIAGAVKQKALPQTDKPMLPQELNEKRNVVLNQIESSAAREINEKRGKIFAEIVTKIVEPLPETEYKPLSAEETERRKQEIRNQLERVG